MFCQKCGATIENGEKFCRACGAPVPGSAASGIPVNGPSVPPKTPGPAPVKKPITLTKQNKLFIILGSVAAVAVLIFIIAMVATADTRAMNKALKSKNGAEVMQVYNELAQKGKSAVADEAIASYIQDATDTLNNDFSCDVSTMQSSGDVSDALGAFMYDNFGNIFGEYNGGGSYLEDIPSYIVEDALEAFDDMASSKYSYYSGVYKLQNASDLEDYEQCLDVFQQVLESDVNYSDSVTKSGEAFDAYLQKVSETADQYIAEGDYAAAIDFLEDYLDDEDSEFAGEMKAKLDELKKTYADNYMTKAATEFQNGDVDAAVGNVEAAIAIFPDETYQVKLDEYKLYLPYALYEKDNWLSRSEDYRISYCSSETAVNKTEYKNCIEYRYTQDCNPSTISFLLEGKYDTVSGVYFSPKVNAEDNRTGSVYFEAYGDGKLLYTSPTISAESLPIDISFSVTNVQKLEIKFIGTGSSVWGFDAQWYGDYAELAGLTAQKNLPQ